MAKELFKHFNFRENRLSLINKCNVLLDSYAEQGYDMTLRQLYYRLVAANEIANKPTEYDRLGVIVSDARLAGLIDWSSIVDRTRSLKGSNHWTDPAEIIRATAGSFLIDKWARQDYRIEIWIEKDALAGVFSRVAYEMDLDFFSCRGFTSISEMYRAGKRFAQYEKEGKQVIILHFGDQDPSGVDMTRDIRERLALFAGQEITVDRLALNMEQVRSYNPPPNPVKLSDSKAKGYIKLYGSSCWELDALEPNVLADLVRDTVSTYIDKNTWEEDLKIERQQVAELKRISDNYGDINRYLNISRGVIPF